MEGTREQQNLVRSLLLLIGEDPDREGLRDTPSRVLRSYRELFSGYGQDPRVLLKTFDGEGYDEMVLVKDVVVESFCEHHLLPFHGVAHVAYVPDGGRVVGLSKLARLVDVYARRLQLQERLTVQVTRALDEVLKPRGSACVVEATHLCLTCRGARKPGSTMVTSSLTGCFKADDKTRAEFMELIK
jgi:GTP cyclohydrolase I